MDFANLLTPALQKTCPNCGGCGRPVRWPYMACEPCNGTGLVPNGAGRGLLDVLGDGPIPLLPAAAKP